MYCKIHSKRNIHRGKPDIIQLISNYKSIKYSLQVDIYLYSLGYYISYRGGGYMALGKNQKTIEREESKKKWRRKKGKK